MSIHTATASWSTCWSRSRRLNLVCRALASPSTCPPSSSTARLSSTTGSVVSSWVSRRPQTAGKKRWGVCSLWLLTLTLWRFRGAAVHRGPAVEAEDVAENWHDRQWQVRTGAQSVICWVCAWKTQFDLLLLFSARQVQDIPDALALMEEAEGAPDPLFGVMFMGDATLSPSVLIPVG